MRTIFKLLITGLMISLVGMAMPAVAQNNIGGPGSGNGGTTSGFTNPLGETTSLQSIILKVVNFLLSFAAVLALAALVVGGLYYIASFGNESRTETGKKAITYAIIGLLIIGASFAIITTIQTILF